MGQQESKKPSQIFSATFYFVAVLMVIFGFVFAYQDSSYNQIVGGDAYNYIIFATRGVVWIGTGIVAAILGLACQLLNLKDELLKQKSIN